MHVGGTSATGRAVTAALNGCSLAFKAVAYAHLRCKERRATAVPDTRIISVGNLAFGGTGKTALIIDLGAFLERRGVKFAVITRGYRSFLERQGGEVLAAHSTRDVGDEAKLLKRRFPAQNVFVGRDRHRSIQRALAKDNRVLILDDGFQSQDIHQDWPILLIDPDQPYYYLRHFYFLMRRARSVFFFRTVPPRFRNFSSGTYSFAIEGFFDRDGRIVDIAAAGRFAAFAGLGNNRRFQQDLTAFHPAGFREYPDHHRYTATDVRSLNDWGREMGASCLVCTEKDFVKVAELAWPGLPFIYARNRIELSVDLFTQIAEHVQAEGIL